MLPTGKRALGGEVVQDERGYEYVTAPGVPRKRAPPAIDHEAQAQEGLPFVMSLPGVRDSFVREGLTIKEAKALVLTNKELAENEALKKQIAFGHFQRLRGHPYLYRYDPVYDPKAGWPQPIAARNFNFGQVLNFGDGEGSTAEFPQEWKLAEWKRLTPKVQKDLRQTMLELGGVYWEPHPELAIAHHGPNVVKQDPYVTLPLKKGAAVSVVTPREVYTVNDSWRRYDVPTNRRELSTGPIHGPGVVLFDRPGTVQAIHEAHPGKMSRYHIAGRDTPV